MSDIQTKVKDAFGRAKRLVKRKAQSAALITATAATTVAGIVPQEASARNNDSIPVNQNVTIVVDGESMEANDKSVHFYTKENNPSQRVHRTEISNQPYYDAPQTEARRPGNRRQQQADAETAFKNSLPRAVQDHIDRNDLIIDLELTDGLDAVGTHGGNRSAKTQYGWAVACYHKSNQNKIYLIPNRLEKDNITTSTRQSLSNAKIQRKGHYGNTDTKQSWNVKIGNVRMSGNSDGARNVQVKGPGNSSFGVRRSKKGDTHYNVRTKGFGYNGGLNH